MALVRLQWTLLVATVAFTAGCPASTEDVQPPENAFFFPSGLALSPDEQYLFVTNANSDLRYDSGTLGVVDLEAVEEYASPWIASSTVVDPNLCAIDLDRRETLVCTEEAGLVLPDATVRIGNFAGQVRVQSMDDGQLRIYTPVRGDPSLTWVDFEPTSAELTCGGSGRVPRCDAAHRLSSLFNDTENVPLSDEPFGLYVDSGNGFVIVSHLTSGNLALAEAPPDGSAPVLVDIKTGFFDQNPSTGQRGAVAVAGQAPGTDDGLVYVTSRAESRIAMVDVKRPGGPTTHPTLVPTEYFFLNVILSASDSRDLVFTDGGDRLQVINRSPPMLITVDTSDSVYGRPRNEVISSVEICAQASLMTAADLGQGTRVFISCYRDGQVWVVDPVGGVLSAIIDVGRGPNALAVAAGRKRMYVTNFLENTVAVVDLTPGAKTENRVVLRIGRPGEDE